VKASTPATKQERNGTTRVEGNPPTGVSRVSTSFHENTMPSTSARTVSRVGRNPKSVVEGAARAPPNTR
jgi:hypothetical protein